MTADDLETDVCCFFVIVTAGYVDCGNVFSNMLWSVQTEEPVDRIIFVKQIYLFRWRFFL